MKDLNKPTGWSAERTAHGETLRAEEEARKARAREKRAQQADDEAIMANLKIAIPGGGDNAAVASNKILIAKLLREDAALALLDAFTILDDKFNDAAPGQDRATLKEAMAVDIKTSISGLKSLAKIILQPDLAAKLAEGNLQPVAQFSAVKKGKTDNGEEYERSDREKVKGWAQRLKQSADILSSALNSEKIETIRQAATTLNTLAEVAKLCRAEHLLGMSATHIDLQAGTPREIGGAKNLTDTEREDLQKDAKEARLLLSATTNYPGIKGPVVSPKTEIGGGRQ